MSRIIVDDQALATYLQGMEQMITDMCGCFREKSQAYEQDSKIYASLISAIEEKRTQYRREVDIAESEVRNAKDDEAESQHKSTSAQKRYDAFSGKLNALSQLERKLQEAWESTGADVYNKLLLMEISARDSSSIWSKAKIGLQDYIRILIQDRNDWEATSTTGPGIASVEPSQMSGAAVTKRGRKPSYVMHQAVNMAPDGKKHLIVSIGGEQFETQLTKAGVAAAYRKAVACKDEEMIARCNALFEIETMRQTLGLKTTSGDVLQLGGYHKEVKGHPGYESHHIPQRSVQDVNADYLPSIALLDDDHKFTDSYAGKSGRVYQPMIPGSYEPVSYKQGVGKEIRDGKYLHVVYCELLNLKEQFGEKYNSAISQYLDSLADMVASRGIPDLK